MFLFFVIGRRLNAASPSQDRQEWSTFFETLVEGCDAEGTWAYAPPPGLISMSRKSPFGDHAGILAFTDPLVASREASVVMARLLRNASDGAATWAALGATYRAVDDYAPEANDGAPVARSRPCTPDVPDGARGMYMVSWRPEHEAKLELERWYADHLQWNGETYHALAGVRCVRVDGSEVPVTYPFDWLVLYWFDLVSALDDMCVDLTDRYRRGWPDAARWTDVALADRAPFVAAT